MTKTELNTILDRHGLWLQGEDGCRADLSGANLRDADLSDADLSDADLDYAAWPLWCGSLGVKVDARIARQLAYHLCGLDCDDPEYLTVRNAVTGFANKFHRVGECSELKPIEVLEIVQEVERIED